MKQITSIQDVVQGQLCSGCGACAFLAPERFEMIDVLEEGRRPAIKAPEAAAVTPSEAELVAVCPGAGLTHDFDAKDPALEKSLVAGWGPVRALWEGYATDPDLRFGGSSGGAASALALYALEHAHYSGVLHTGAREDIPYLNETVVSRSRAELLSRTGSRYAPASPCDGLHHVETGDGPYVFIGKPCDVAAAQAARRLRPALDQNLGITIAFFCAGTPSTQGTLEMLRAMGIEDPEAISSLRYRGNGWPGNATATLRQPDGTVTTSEMSYAASWGGVLSKHVQWRCRLCIDHTGEFADIAVGDPWYREIQSGEHGSSLIVARSDRGVRFLDAAIDAGYLKASPTDASLLPASQPNLLRTRGAVWGRRLGSRLAGAAVPRYKEMASFRFWLKNVSNIEKVRSILGSARRTLARGIGDNRAPFTGSASGSKPVSEYTRERQQQDVN